MTRKFILVGCGNVGSRHLQALAKLPFEIHVDIVEPNDDAKKLGEFRLNEIQYDKTNHIFSWHRSINELTNKSDLAIIATTSVGRVDIITKLLDSGHTRFLIEKVVCQSTEEYDNLLSKMKLFNAKGWVNTNQRYFKTYQKIKDYFRESQIIHLSVTTSANRGLGTNAIHYIDLFSWLSGDHKIRLNGEFLFNALFPNKRGNHFMDFAGTIIGSINNGSSLVLTFIPDTNLPLIINIIGKNKHLMIDETNEKIINLINGDHSFEYKYEHPSNLTTRIVQDILEKDYCLLPTLADLYYPHKELFHIFNSHIKKIMNEEKRLCPIT